MAGNAGRTGRTMIKERVAAVSLDEMKFALHLMSAAANLTLPMESPAARHCNIFDERTGETLRLSFPDKPTNRAIFALADHFAFETSAAILQRFTALYRIKSRAEFGRWIRRKDTFTEFEDAILHAAGKANLQWGGKSFNIRELAKLAEDFR
jgi:hypothetical protein